VNWLSDHSNTGMLKESTYFLDAPAGCSMYAERRGVDALVSENVVSQVKEIRNLPLL
jgi:hypothetical protein